MIKYFLTENKIINIKKNNEWEKIFDEVCSVASKQLKIKDELFFDLTFLTNNQIQKINKKFRSKNNPTDVITFAFWDNKEIKTPHLGEIYISFEKALEQSKEFSHSIQREIIFLLIHGLLHLFGHLHNNKKNEKKMLKLSYKIIKKLNLQKEFIERK